ncbi:hepatocyte nuclear factor 1-beta-A-like [Oscarella lobularis]|uniref:hepatocyte nuclear factor 1-beta-A-like n=1 Tax=Oscarella lobularis TaxID=121494 RepID=UPI003313CB62
MPLPKKMATPEQKQYVKSLLEQQGITREILLSCFDDEPFPVEATLLHAGEKRKLTDAAEGPSKTRNLTEEDQQLVEELCRHDPIIAAKIIHAYIHKHGVLQRDIVNATSLSQSHLSQHLNNGTSMNLAKRRKLYEWYVEDQRTYGRGLDSSVSFASAVSSASESGNAVAAAAAAVTPTSGSSRSSRTRSQARRTKVKWCNEALKVLNDAYRLNPRPDKETRVELVRKCAALEAEHLEQKMSVPGSETPDVLTVVTEERVLTWFANKRKDELQRNRLQQAEAAVRLAATAQPHLHQMLSDTVQVDGIQGGSEPQHVLLVQTTPAGGVPGGTPQYVQVAIETSHASTTGTSFIVQNPIPVSSSRSSDSTPGATYVVESAMSGHVTTPVQQDMTVAAETVEVTTAEVESTSAAAASVVVGVETEVPMEGAPIAQITEEVVTGAREGDTNGIAQEREGEQRLQQNGNEKDDRMVTTVVTQVLDASISEGDQ